MGLKLTTAASLLIGLGLLVGAGTPKKNTAWTHRFEYLTLEEAKNVARNRINIPPASTRQDVLGWQPFNFPNGDPYREVAKSRGNASTYDQKLFSNLSHELDYPNNAAFYNVEMLAPTNTALKWYCRMGNLGTLKVHTAKVVGITGPHNYYPNEVRQYPIEHAFYCETVYGAEFTNSLFEDLGGHGIYIAYRPNQFQQYPPSNKPFDRKPFYSVKGVSLIDTEQDASRGSHSITFFDPGSGEFPGTIIVEDTCIINGWDFERYQGTNERFDISNNPNRVRSCGPMVVTNYEEFPEEGWPTELLVLRSCVWWQVKAKHSMGDLRNIQEVLIEDCFFRAEDHMQPYINLGGKKDDPRFKAPERVVIRNCKSDGVTLRIWRNENDFDLIDLNTVGTEFIWTP